MLAQISMQKGRPRDGPFFVGFHGAQRASLVIFCSIISATEPVVPFV